MINKRLLVTIFIVAISCTFTTGVVQANTIYTTRELRSEKINSFFEFSMEGKIKEVTENGVLVSFEATLPDELFNDVNYIVSRLINYSTGSEIRFELEKNNEENKFYTEINIDSSYEDGEWSLQHEITKSNWNSVCVTQLAFIKNGEEIKFEKDEENKLVNVTIDIGTEYGDKKAAKFAEWYKANSENYMISEDGGFGYGIRSYMYSISEKQEKPYENPFYPLAEVCINVPIGDGLTKEDWEDVYEAEAKGYVTVNIEFDPIKNVEVVVIKRVDSVIARNYDLGIWIFENRTIGGNIEGPVLPEEPISPETPIVPEDSNNITKPEESNDIETLPQTGGVNGNIVIAAGMFLVVIGSRMIKR